MNEGVRSPLILTVHAPQREAFVQPSSSLGPRVVDGDQLARLVSRVEDLANLLHQRGHRRGEQRARGIADELEQLVAGRAA